jgi:DNA-nicking Smr family endonuclease
MMDEESKSLWEKVCATVNRLGQPRSPRVRVSPEPKPASTLDLHGFTVQDAFYATKQFINRPNAPLVLTIITGKSGTICREFPEWCWRLDRVRSVTQMNGGGAFEVRLKKA